DDDSSGSDDDSEPQYFSKRRRRRRRKRIPDLTTTGPCSAWGLGVVTLTAQCADEREDG
ncbi:unnamed protein product, partial [Pylaiella littoralis]